MSKIGQTFQRLKNEGRAALIPFIVAGDPDLETTEALIIKMAESGAEIIELGVPFSDPLADGPIIQAASQRALKNGVSLREIFRLTERLKGITTPLVLMTYFNPVLRYGLKNSAEGCKQGRIDGVIIPDLPPEEAGVWVSEARRMNLDTIFFVAPTSPPERIRSVIRFSRGFIYYVSVTGVTGTRNRLPEDLELTIKRIKEYSKKPVAVGFGISTPEQAKSISRFADGIIVGSAIVKIIKENLNHPDLIAKVGDFVSSLAKALKS
jgi:tryptophan synthase alpha chain